MTNKNMIREEIKKILNIEEAQIERPENEKLGDYSTSLALKLAKEEKKSSLEIAKEIKNKILKIKNNIFEKIEIVKPGFINFFLAKEYLQSQIAEILKQGAKYSQLDIGRYEKVQVEFISANPTGPLTLGNARGGFLGDTLASILDKAGYEVEREFYINDAGEQVVKLGHSVLGDNEAVYRGAYIEDLRQKIKIEGKSAKEIGQEAANLIIEQMIRPVIEQKMKIKFDNWFAESILHELGLVEKIIQLLKQKKLAYEKEGALWFGSTKFGDDKDRVLVKADGEKTYLASDIAYLKNKFDRNFNQLIYIWGADHHGYVGRLKAAVQALGHDPETVKIIIVQLVRLTEGGKEVKMSKRTGTFVTLEELIDEVGLDVAKFFMLMRSADSHLNFDLSLAKEQSEKNPVYYVQYAHARICSILAKLKTQNSKLKATTQNLNLLSHKAELDLIKQLIRLPEIVEDTAKDYQVQRLPQFALDLVTAFHKFYEECRVIDEKNKELTEARLALVEATRVILKNALDLMGISAPERM